MSVTLVARSIKPATGDRPCASFSASCQRRVTIGYFVLFAASKADGGIKIFGTVLAIWLFVIAVFIPIIGANVTLAGLCPIDDIVRTLYSAKP